MEFAALANDYGNFYAPAFAIEIAGENIVGQGVEVTNLSMDNVLNEADHFSFTVNNAFDAGKKELKWLDQLFTVGTKIKLKMGYADRQRLMLVGLITSVTARFPSGGHPQLEVSGYDLSYRLIKGMESRSWEKITHSEIARRLAGEHYLGSLIDDTRIPYPSVYKPDGKSDYHFLRDLAEKNYFDFYVDNETLCFLTRNKKRKEPIMTLEWGYNLLSFSPEINLANQVMEVELRGWDPQTKKEFVGRAKIDEELGRDCDDRRKSGADLVQGIFHKAVVEYVARPVFSQEEANRLAKSILNKRGEELVTGSGETIGIPEIVAGKYIQLAGLGKKFCKVYFIDKSNHTISSSGYRTTFHIKENKI